MIAEAGMSSAYTKGAKRRNKRRINAARRAAGILPGRTASGRRGAQEGDTEHQARETVALARCRHRGWAPNAENLRRVMDAREGYVLGRLWADGAVTQRQHDAGKKYAETAQAYRVAVGLPPLTAPAPLYGDVRGGGADWDVETTRAAIDAHRGAQRALRASGCHLMVEAVVIHDEEPLSGASLRLGLDALAEHFGV